MDDKQILDEVWIAHREEPFASFTQQKQLNLTHDELSRLLTMLNENADTEKPVHGYVIERCSPTTYKVAHAQDIYGYAVSQ